MKYYLVPSRGFSKTLSRMRMIKQRSDDMSIEWGDSIRENETITFEYRTTSRGTVDEYECSCCGCYIYFPAYDTYASEKIDYDYCPYCGKPVAKE